MEKDNILKEKIRDFLTKGRPDDFKGIFAFKDDRGYEIGYIGEDKKPFPISDGLIGSEETRKNVSIFDEVINEPKMKLLIQKNEVLKRIKDSKTTNETNNINKPKFN